MRLVDARGINFVTVSMAKQQQNLGGTFGKNANNHSGDMMDNELSI